MAKETKQRKIIAGPWKLERKFGHQDGPGKLSGASGVAFSPNGNMAIADWKASKIRIYSIDGVHKCSVDTSQGQQSYPGQVAVNSENEILLTDLNEHIRMYEISGKFKNQWVSSCPHASSGSPMLVGLAMDHTGNLIVGDCQSNCINKHRQDGTLLGSTKVGISPKYIAVTSQNLIVIADWHRPPQIVSSTGQVMHTLKHPEEESQWSPWGVYCHEDIICVANLKTRNILCYTESGKYLGPISIPPVFPFGGLAITADGMTLVVCDLYGTPQRSITTSLQKTR